MSELHVQAIFGETDEERREAWITIFQQSMTEQQKTEPYYLEDKVETQVMMGRDTPGFFLDYQEHEYQAETIFEAEFLSYLTLALGRGTPFQEAWSRAVRLVSDNYQVVQVVYDLKLDDKSEVELWTERLTGMGVEPDASVLLAQDATKLLRQIWLVQAGFYDEGWLSESDQDDRKILLEKLHVGDPTPDALTGGQK